MVKQETISLIDELGLKSTFDMVAQDRGKIVYAHTVYYEVEDIDYEKYVTETDEPVDNIFSEKQQRLSIDTLQTDKINWTTRNFMTASNVGIYYDKNITRPVVPDMFLSFEVKQADNWFEKKNKAYFTWVMGKSPDLVLEIVSNKVGDEDTEKLRIYAKMGVKYYIIQDPYQYLSQEKLRLYVLNAEGEYVKHKAEHEEDLYYMPEVNLGMTLWRGLYEDTEAEWMRWCNKDGNMLFTGKEAIAKQIEEKEKERERAEKERIEKEKERERAEKERIEKEKERKRAEQERNRAEQERNRAEQERIEKEKERERSQKLFAKLLALGLRPDEIEGDI